MWHKNHHSGMQHYDNFQSFAYYQQFGEWIQPTMEQFFGKF
jgi:hypothetical protein